MKSTTLLTFFSTLLIAGRDHVLVCKDDLICKNCLNSRKYYHIQLMIAPFIFRVGEGQLFLLLLA